MDDERSQVLDNLSLYIVNSIKEVDETSWDYCARTGTSDANPFVRHSFLLAMEDSGSVQTETGWLPQHVIIKSPSDEIFGCAPLYLKSHSYGEYVFDWGWANAYERAGGRYYPKLQCAIPFTPVTSSRLMVRPDLTGEHATEVRHSLVSGMIELAKHHDVSSLHVTFPNKDECELMTKAGMLARFGQQYHWENKGYETFDDFLLDLSSRKRKNIRKERETAVASGVTITSITGDDIQSKHWDSFYKFYVDTSVRKWGQAYLTRDFFDLLSNLMSEQIVLIMGEENGNLVCGALNFLGGNALYGRNWGTIVDHPMLHFEVCYYRAIDFAIKRKLDRVEAGAQGPHKLQRGYLPQKTYSSHWIADEGFRTAVARFVAHEREAIDHDVEVLQGLGPFKRTD